LDKPEPGPPVSAAGADVVTPCDTGKRRLVTRMVAMTIALSRKNGRRGLTDPGVFTVMLLSRV